MAAQQILFSETVAAMKKAMKRTAYESDSDDEIEHYSNRGNKLKKRALFAHQGQLVPPSGPEVYKKTVDYAGAQRSIINRNPPVLDDEGYEVESDDDPADERVEEALASAAEANPYSGIHLEQLLAPLTASTDIPTHPTLSKPFTTETLTNLADQSCAVMHKENQSLWRVKHLLTRLNGDHTWAPCEMMVGPTDAELFSDEAVAQSLLKQVRERQANGAVVNGAEPSAEHHGKPETSGTGASGKVVEGDTKTNPAEIEDVSMTDALNGGKDQEKKEEADAGESKEGNGTDGGQTEKGGEGTKSPGPTTNGERSATSGDGETAVVPSKEGKDKGNAEDQDVEMQQDGANPTRPETDEAGAGTDGDGDNDGDDTLSIASHMIDELFIHPVFRPPPNAQPAREGLSESEAEEMRRLVSSYVQKQEEICRGAQKLHEGLLKADRLRKNVLHWSKAEAHSGTNRDMSDGEDWYDKEEWGLSEDLKKGQDEEEEETGTATKKTRNRRNN